MKIDFILQLLAYCIPALITAALSYVYFNKILEKQNKRDHFLISTLQKPTIDTNALKLQACERLTLLIERIDLQKLLLRIQPTSDIKDNYQFLLIQHINQEFEYNLSQQIYISSELWEIIVQTKNTIISTIQKGTALPNVNNAYELQTFLLQQSQQLARNTEISLSAIKAEAQNYL